MPLCGTRKRTSKTEISASATLMRMEVSCSPMPLSMESTAASTYITGISGASRRR